MGYHRHAHHSISCGGFIFIGLSWIWFGHVVFYCLLAIGLLLLMVGGVVHWRRRRAYYLMHDDHCGEHVYVVSNQPVYAQYQAAPTYATPAQGYYPAQPQYPAHAATQYPAQPQYAQPTYAQPPAGYYPPNAAAQPPPYHAPTAPPPYQP
eukprot:TRINITY_DN7379_c0_g1_i1.p1 TRINITY_DN7379_c0_g1~~TRINITY_DN7379_c0_g1_i1.p1  ORF type:complete len:150 (-),score=30.86 TRINITY_DN7379_c0_g1_i1:468-917(-)